MSAENAYHHGNLRRALMDEALAVIKEKGVEGLSMREVSARLGVSHTAPYHHFADKAALIHSLAHEGLARMDEAMAAAVDAAGEDCVERLMAIGMGYVTFAIDRPDYCVCIMAPGRPEMPGDITQPHDHGQGRDPWARLLDTVVECKRAGRLRAADPVMSAVSLWALVHGVVELWRVGPLSKLPQAAEGFEPFARQVFQRALDNVTRKDGT